MENKEWSYGANNSSNTMILGVETHGIKLEEGIGPNSKEMIFFLDGKRCWK